MKEEDILALGELARIELSSVEVERFSKDIEAILGYVASVRGLAEGISSEPKLGVIANVFREDENPHEPGLYTEDLLNLAPSRKGQYVEVKKILGE